jgi:hypothetical protein
LSEGLEARRVKALRSESRDGDMHVMPNFGKEHEISSDCWCCPVPQETGGAEAYVDALTWVHEVQQ